MTSEKLDLARDLLASATQHSITEIPDDAAINNFLAWDSLAHMRLILAIEERLGRELAPESIMALSSLHEVAACFVESR